MVMHLRFWIALAALLLLQNPALAAEAVYGQDGNPHLANGSATTSITHINALDDASYNITGALIGTTEDVFQLVRNGNFTGGIGTNWNYDEYDPNGRAASAFLSTGGDIEPGRWRFTMTDNSRFAGYSAYGNLTNAGTNWDGGVPDESVLYFSFYKNHNNAPTTNTLSAFLLRPDGSLVLVWTNATVYSSTTYSRIGIPIGPGNFSQAGIYRIRLYNYVQTPVNGRPTVNNYWDQASLELKKGSNFYAMGVWHNSSSISIPANLDWINAINISLRFISDGAITPALQILNFAAESWESSGCTPQAPIHAAEWQLWNCQISASPSDYISTDGNRRLRVRLFTPDAHSPQAVISEDWIEYRVFFGAEPSLSVGKPSYSACGMVYYEASFFDLDEQPHAPDIGVNITVLGPSSTMSESTIAASGGVYRGAYQLPASAPSGNWLIKALSGAVGKHQFFVGSGNADVWRIDLLFSNTKGAYSSQETVPASFTVWNLLGAGATSLALGSNLWLFRDLAPYSPSIINHNNGTYSFEMAFSGLGTNAAHTLRVVANTGLVDVSTMRGFYVE